MNGYLLKRLVEICLAGGGADARCSAQRLEAEALRIGFSSEHGRALHRLVGFCTGRLGDCVSLTSGLTRELLTGEEASAAYRRLLVSLSKVSPQAVADTKTLLTAERRPAATTTAAAAAAAADGAADRPSAFAFSGALRRKRSLTGHQEAADLPATLGGGGGASGAADGGGARAKRSVSPFMIGMYVRFSKECGSQPCPTGWVPTQQRVRVMEQ